MSLLYRLLSFIGIAILSGIAISTFLWVAMMGYAFILRSLRYAFDFMSSENKNFKEWLSSKLPNKKQR